MPAEKSEEKPGNSTVECKWGRGGNHSHSHSHGKGSGRWHMRGGDHSGEHTHDGPFRRGPFGPGGKGPKGPGGWRFGPRGPGSKGPGPHSHEHIDGEGITRNM